MPRQSRDKTQETREKVLRAALDVFSAKGFSSSTLEDIARHIGMTRGAVYWHFRNKQDLLLALIQMMMQREKQLVRQQVPALATPQDLIDSYLAMADLLDQDAEYRKFIHFIFLQVEWATEQEVTARVKQVSARDGHFIKIYEAMEAMQRSGEIRADADLAQIFDVMMGLFTGLVRGALSGMAKAPLRESLKAGLEAVFAVLPGGTERAPGSPENGAAQRIKKRKSGG